MTVAIDAARRSSVFRKVSGDRLDAAFWALMVFTFILFVGPQYFVPGLHVIRPALLAAGAAIALYVSRRVAQGGRLTVTHPPVILLGVLLGLGALSIPTSLWRGGSFDVLVNQLLKSVVVALLLANILHSPRRLKLLMASLVCWGVVMTLVALRDYAAGNLALAGQRIAGYDSPLAANPNDLALTLNLIIAFAVGLVFAIRRRACRLVLVGAIVLMVGGVIVSFSRAGFVVLVAIAGAFLWQRLRRRDVVTVLGAVLIAGTLVIFVPSGYGDRMYSLLDFQADATGSALARWTSTVTAIEMIMERPLFGFGLGMNRLEFVERNLGWTHVHNAVLEVGADAGVPAMIVYVLILWHLFRGLHRAAKRFRAHRASEHEALAGGVQLALIGFVVATLFYPVAYHFYLFYIAGFALALQAMRTSPPAPPSASRRGRVPRWLRVHA